MRSVTVEDVSLFVKRCELTPNNVMQFAKWARGLWEDDPEQMHKLEWEMRQRVLLAAGKNAVLPGALAQMCATLARLGAARSLTRWFA